MFIELSMVLVAAAVIAAFMRLLKQPLIIGYILTGIVVGPLIFDVIHSEELYQVLSELGIAFLLFIVGINLSPRVIKEVGKASVLTGVGQIIFTMLVGYLLSTLMGFPPVVAVYLAAALTFSSTIIILKLLSDKLALEKLYGKVSVGFLIVQDIVAVLILILASSLANTENILATALISALKLLFMVGLVMYISRRILPQLTNFFARQQELLFLMSIAWGLGLASLFAKLGFSIEIGALAAGVSLAALPYSVEISARLKPLRDFFILVFFILLGGQTIIAGSSMFIWPVVIFSLFILIGNPLIVIIIMGLLGHNKRTGFLAGLTVAQISEFSIVLILLGIKLGHLDQGILAIVTTVGIITIAGSSYMIMYAEKIYPKIAHILAFADKLSRKKAAEVSDNQVKYDAILFGLNRVGHDFLHVFLEKKFKFLVVDFDPEVGEQMKREKIDFQYGDADDSEFLESLPLDRVKIVVSTIPDFSSNALLVDKIRKVNKNAVIITLNHSIREARELYDRGASYVVLPHFLGGRLASEMVRKYGSKSAEYKKERDEHLVHLQERLDKGHEHPVREALR